MANTDGAASVTSVTTEAPDLPIACNLTASELRARGDEIASLFDHVLHMRELPDGYSFAFPGETSQAQALLDFIITERACCPFFTFELTFPSPHQAVWLDVRGGVGVKDFVRDTLVAKLAAN
ncbi:MAG: hypothetical protein OJF49_000646 [Ktedonobacterales bacterium]|jgi:hypothetical protein|nr:MAG: hypothetical protein OJF49_000646 [Ktedonobacterales bacterium]